MKKLIYRSIFTCTSTTDQQHMLNLITKHENLFHGMPEGNATSVHVESKYIPRLYYLDSFTKEIDGKTSIRVNLYIEVSGEANHKLFPSKLDQYNS